MFLATLIYEKKDFPKIKDIIFQCLKDQAESISIISVVSQTV
jgi:hypothetical protein